MDVNGFVWKIGYTKIPWFIMVYHGLWWFSNTPFPDIAHFACTVSLHGICWTLSKFFSRGGPHAVENYQIDVYNNNDNIYMIYDIYIYIHTCIALHCIALHYIALHCITLHCIALHYIALHCIAFHCIALHCIALHYIALHCIALHYIALHCIAFHSIALHCIALHCIALHCIALHYITLHTYIH